jgi:hypothetical protein
MRTVLAMGLLIALGASASAAKLHHGKLRDAVAGPVQSVSPGLAPELSPQERKRLHDINIPSYDDPSRRGGA